MAAFAEFFSVKSAVRRLKYRPLMTRAWLANLAIAKGIQHYYAKRGRRVPRFSDFLDPSSRAWNDVNVGEDRGSLARSTAGDPAALAVARSDPFHQVNATLASLTPAPVEATGR